MGPVQLSSVICTTVFLMQHLRILDVGTIPLTTECIIHHSALLNLHTLTAAIAADGLAQRTAITDPQVSFSSLQELTIRVKSLTTATVFIERFLRTSCLDTSVVGRMLPFRHL